MWEIAHWAQHWAPMIRNEDVRLSKPGVKLAVRMTTKDNLAISWTPHIPADAVVPDELRTWISELHQPLGYNTPGNDLYFINDAGRLRDHLENGGDIGDPVLASLLVAALQHIIADLPRKDASTWSMHGGKTTSSYAKLIQTKKSKPSFTFTMAGTSVSITMKISPTMQKRKPV